VTPVLTLLACLLAIVLSTPTVCRRGVPSGYNVAHGFGKRTPWATLLGRSRTVDVRRVPVFTETRPSYAAYDASLSDDEPPTDTF